VGYGVWVVGCLLLLALRSEPILSPVLLLGRAPLEQFVCKERKSVRKVSIYVYYDLIYVYYDFERC